MNNKKPGMMVHTYNPKYMGGQGRRLTVQGQPPEKARLYLKNKLKQKGLGGVAQVKKTSFFTRKFITEGIGGIRKDQSILCACITMESHYFVKLIYTNKNNEKRVH
jgi:hypothetical protein